MGLAPDPKKQQRKEQAEAAEGVVVTVIIDEGTDDEQRHSFRYADTSLWDGLVFHEATGLTIIGALNAYMRAADPTIYAGMFAWFARYLAGETDLELKTVLDSLNYDQTYDISDKPEDATEAPDNPLS